MQTSMVHHINEMNHVSAELQQRNTELSAIKIQVEESNRMKTDLIHQIADKMIPPVKMLEGAMKELKSNYEHLTSADIHTMVENVIANAKGITSLIDKMLQFPQKKKS
jgi:light-regulated signal transduction histidine kinase (bacteriophytochrome)